MPARPPTPARFSATPLDELDRIIAELRSAAPGWATTTLDDRIELLDRVIHDTAAVADEWVEDACAAKDIPLDSQLVWEEVAFGPVFLIRAARLLRSSLVDLRDHGRPRPPGPVTQRADGQTVVGVFPTDTFDRIVYPGTTAEVWMEPGINPGNLAGAMAGRLRPESPPPPEVAVVLGAGNVSGIGPLDVLDQVIVRSRVAVLKANPINDYLVPHWRAAFAAFIERDLVAVVAGGAEVGTHLTRHPDIDAIHLTGSDTTHDAIVFGTGPEGAARKAAGEPVVTKEITAELGNVTPVIVVPGPWSEADIEYQAADLAGSLVQNAGFNCTTTRVIITHAQWNQREDFLAAVGRHLAAAPPRVPYYPGAEDRWKAFAGAHPDARTFGPGGPGRVPWTLIEGVDPANTDDLVFTTEAFCGVFAETALDVDRDVAAFLDAAVDFANQHLAGSLSATIVAHPATTGDPVLGAAVEDAISRLRYGSVALNAWVALGFGLMSTTWGAFPGNPIDAIESGVGVVHNTYLFDQPQKSVIRAPFRSAVQPVWHTGARPAKALRKMVDFEAAPSLTRLPGLLAAALRG